MSFTLACVCPQVIIVAIAYVCAMVVVHRKDTIRAFLRKITPSAVTK